MKNIIKYCLQKLFGYDRYLYLFSIFKIKTLKGDSKEGDFFHFLDQIKEKGLLLDIGANIGIMTYYLSKMGSGQVHAFEPIPSNLSVLRKIIAKFDLSNVTVHDIALGDQETTLEMVLPVVQDVRMQGLSHVVHESIDEFNEGEKFEVQAKTLDGLSLQKVAGIKIDVENFEYFVLKGGIELLTRDKPVIYIELWENENRHQCLDLLASIGYKNMVVVNNKLVPYTPAHPHQNFILI